MGRASSKRGLWRRFSDLVLRSLRRTLALLRRASDRGRTGERVAAQFLKRRGLRILERNARERREEIDLVALDGDALVFVEVKSRGVHEGDPWTGLENFGPRKRRALRRACEAYRRRLARPAEGYRVDLVAVEFVGRGVRAIRWYRDVLDLDGY